MATAIDLLHACKACGHEFRVPARLGGKTIACPHCHRQQAVAAPTAAVASDDKLVGKELGRCRLIRRLGAGALGVVYEAEQVSTGRRVAVKMLSSKAAAMAEVVSRFQREAKLSAQMHHPSVVGVYDCGFDRGVHFLVMEFVEGSTLAGLIEDNGKLPWDQATRIILQMAKALQYAHSNNIIHRDIKPANILVGTGDVAKLADLGLAKRMEPDADPEAGLTMQGMALGSPAYMPPEQIRSARDATHLADIYALGATWYQAVSGKLPFEGRNGTEVMTKVLREEPPALATLVPGIPAGVAALIQQMMAKEPSARPQSCDLLITEIETVLANPEGRPKPRGTARSGAKPGPAGASTGGSKTGLIIGIAVAVVTVVALIAWLALKK